AEATASLEEARAKEERGKEPADKEIIAMDKPVDGKPADPFEQIDYGSNFNEDGYLTATLEEIATSGGHTVEDVSKALEIVQSFDPAGVAARDLGECLVIQLRFLGEENSVAAQMVQHHLKQLQNKQYQEIARALGRPLNLILAQLEVIKRLDPRP